MVSPPAERPGSGVTASAAVRRSRPGSVAFWDNRAAVHYAMRNYGDFPRLRSGY